MRTESKIDEKAPPVIRKIHKPGKAKPDPIHGLFEAKIAGKSCVVEYEPDSDLRDTEQVPLLEKGGIEAFIRREVLQYAPDAWVKAEQTAIGYEASFTRYFYKPQPLRSLEEIHAQILTLEKETEGWLGRNHWVRQRDDRRTQPYAEYIESGMPWVGRMPSHWQRRRAKVLFSERTQRDFQMNRCWRQPKPKASCEKRLRLTNRHRSKRPPSPETSRHRGFCNQLEIV